MHITTWMQDPARKRKKLNYPEQSQGSRLASKIRAAASKLTAEEEAEHFKKGMARIYGNHAKEISGAGH